MDNDNSTHEHRRDWAALLRLLWDHRRRLAKATAIGLVVAAIISLLIRPQYESTARLMPPDPQSASGLAMMAAAAGAAGGPLGGSNLGGMAANLLGMRTTGAVFVGILQSRTTADTVIDRFDLRKVYWTKRYYDARKKLARRTDISEDRKSGILTLTVTDNDPVRAQQMVLAYIAELDRLLALLNTSTAHRERVFLEGRLQEVKKDLDEASRNFSEFASRNSTLDLRDQGKAMVESAAILQGQLIALESQARGLEQIYTAQNYRVRAARARIAELRAQLQKIGGQPGSVNESTDLPAGELYPSIRKLPLVGIRYADLYRRVRVQETVFEILTRQYELAKVQEAKETPTVRVLDAPVVPEKKSFPPRTIFTLLGAVLSFAGCAGLIVAKDRWQHVDSADPLKSLLVEVAHTARKAVSRNGHPPKPAGDHEWHQDETPEMSEHHR